MNRVSLQGDALFTRLARECSGDDTPATFGAVCAALRSTNGPGSITSLVGNLRRYPERNVPAGFGRTSSQLGSGEQVGARLCEPDEGSAPVQLQPAALDRQVQAGLVFVRHALLAEQERPFDQLDVNPPFLPSLHAVGDLNNLASCFFGIGVRPSEANFIRHPYHSECGDQGAKRNEPVLICGGPICPLSTDTADAACPKSA